MLKLNHGCRGSDLLFNRNRVKEVTERIFKAYDFAYMGSDESGKGDYLVLLSGEWH